jgi:hypothetical protein
MDSYVGCSARVDIWCFRWIHGEPLSQPAINDASCGVFLAVLTASRLFTAATAEMVVWERQAGLLPAPAASMDILSPVDDRFPHPCDFQVRQITMSVVLVLVGSA